jgi:hypothetical protein
MKCVGPGIKDPEAGGEPKGVPNFCKAPVSGASFPQHQKWPSVFLFFFYKKNHMIPTTGKKDLTSRRAFQKKKKKHLPSQVFMLSKKLVSFFF